MRKGIFIFNLCLLALLVIGDVCYINYGGLWLKAVTSLLFVVTGIVNLVYIIKTKKGNIKFSITMSVGLFVAMAGDIVLNLHFIGGAVLFALGHVIFYIAYTFIEKFKLINLVYSACVFVPALGILIFVPVLNYGGVFMQIICIIYTLIISLMVGKAISIFVREKNLFTFLLMIGSFLFFFSDAMLLFDQFSSVSIIFGILCLATYYPAELLLAHSILQQEK